VVDRCASGLEDRRAIAVLLGFKKPFSPPQPTPVVKTCLLFSRKKAIVAVAHSLLVIIYHVLRTKKPYTDLGADYFDSLDTTRIQQHHIRRLEQLGLTVTVTPKEVA
jgi:hypothetical protein